MTSKPWDVYVRVSTDEQGSLPMQTAAAKSMVEIGQRQLGLVLTDDGYSAKDLHRPAMVKLLDRIDRGEIGGVVIYKLDRLTRSVRDLFSLLERLDKTGVALVSVRENIDTSSAMGRFFVGLIGLMAQWEREQLAERVKAGMSFIKSKGGYVGGRVPDGLAVEGDKAKKRLVKHPIWGDVVAQAWKRVSDGATLGELRDWLNEHRLATRKSAWTTTGVHRMLTNETYVGLVVDRHSFEKAKVAMAARQSPGKQGVKVVRREMQGDRVWPLRGLLLCPTCDAKMVGTTATNRHKQPYHFLRCSVRNRRGKQECSQGDLPAEPIELMVLQSLVGVLQRNSPEVLPALRQLQQAADRASGPLSDQRKALGLERDRIAGEMANLGTLAAAGGPTARSLAKPLADRQMALEAIDGRMGEIDANLGLMGMRSLDAERVASELAADAETLLDAEPEVQARSLQALVQEVRLKKLDAKRWEVDLAIHLPRVPAAVFAQPSRLVLRSKLPSNPCPTLALAVQVLRVGQAWRVAIDPIRHARDMPTADIADQLGVTLRQAQRLVRKGHAAARLALS